ncbi:MAG: DUF4177 domain-containing protein [Candidatus Pacebacteria bacterium]|nr:DUF4177 domain-containing protein [Candidatus Paceibacterota bacterium]
MKKFEYKMIIGSPHERIFDDQEMLRSHGAEGWELVSVIYPVKPKNEGIGARAALYYLKRELEK